MFKTALGPSTRPGTPEGETPEIDSSRPCVAGDKFCGCVDLHVNEWAGGCMHAWVCRLVAGCVLVLVRVCKSACLANMNMKSETKINHLARSKCD